MDKNQFVEELKRKEPSLTFNEIQERVKFHFHPKVQFIRGLFQKDLTLSYSEVNDLIKQEFDGSGVSNGWIKRVKDEMNHIESLLSDEIKEAINLMLSLFIHAMSITEFAQLVEKDEENIMNAYELLEGISDE